MTPKEDAHRLLNLYKYEMGYYYNELAKKYALMTVNQIILAFDEYFDRNNLIESQDEDSDLRHWILVKQEIEKV